MLTRCKHNPKIASEYLCAQGGSPARAAGGQAGLRPDDLIAEVETLAAENVKRVHRSPSADPFGTESQTPYEVTAMMEMKTVWHPMGA